MANILDLLMDFKNVTKRNNDISMLYIMYQMLLMVSSILTPGTIFLMVLGALNMAYPTLSLYWALAINLLPVGIFILLCYVAKGDTQVRVVDNRFVNDKSLWKNDNLTVWFKSNEIYTS
jgi:chitin synthase